MLHPSRVLFVAAQVCCLSYLLGSPVQAQNKRGFDQVVVIETSIEDIVRQPDLWMMEVEFKPMRMVYVEINDPQTGEKHKEHIWYLAYRFMNRPLPSRPNVEALPVNELDPLPGPRMFAPRFTLITYENPKTEIPVDILQDDIVPDALPRIRAIEREQLQDSVGLYRELPAIVPVDAEQQPWIYGVATWRNVDPQTDFFKIIATGFSNGYQVPKDAADSATWRKAIVQKFKRPGDEFDPSREEFTFDGDASWEMLPDDK